MLRTKIIFITQCMIRSCVPAMHNKMCKNKQVQVLAGNCFPYTA